MSLTPPVHRNKLRPLAMLRYLFGGGISDQTRSCISVIVSTGMDAGSGPEGQCRQLWQLFADNLQIYRLRILLFQPGEASLPYGVLGLTFTACLQCVAAGLCIWDVAPGSTPHWVQSALVPILHVGWGFYYTVFFLWVSWICSVGGRRSQHLRKWRVCCLLVAPLFISALVGAIPLSLWYPPKTVFLVSYHGLS